MNSIVKTLLLLFLLLPVISNGQGIVGKWQLVKQSNCIEDELDASSAEEEELIAEMKSMSSAAPEVIQFRENRTAEESTKIINKRKSYNSKALLYKFTGSALHILDKKSQTIIESFTVESLSADSLIITNAARACETRVFVKISKPRE
jgi:hypothetical protein